MNLLEVRTNLSMIPDGIQWTALRAKQGRFELHHNGQQTIIGQALCKLVASFTASGYDVFFDIEPTMIGRPHIRAHLWPRSWPYAVEARTPKKAERRGQKPDRRQSKRRTSDKAKARLRR